VATALQTLGDAPGDILVDEELHDAADALIAAAA
jgi:hypothetical protein